MQYCSNVALEKVYLYKCTKDKQICNQWTKIHRNEKMSVFRPRSESSKSTKTVDGRKSRRNEEEEKREIRDRRGARTDGDGPGGMNESVGLGKHSIRIYFQNGLLNSSEMGA